MKRLLFWVMPFLLLGAIVNVAVAWGLSQRRFAEPVLSRPLSEVERERLWDQHASSHAFPPIIGEPKASEVTQFGLSSRSVHLTIGSQKPAREIYIVIQIDAGWPSRSMWGVVFTQIGVGPSQSWRDGFIDSPISDKQNAQLNVGHLPVRVHCPGFAINTLVYGAILGLFFAALFALRRRRRIKRGLCPRCAYPVGANNACTECGAAVKPRPA